MMTKIKGLAKELGIDDLALMRRAKEVGFDTIDIGNFEEVEAILKGHKRAKKKRKPMKFKTLKGTNDKQIEIMLSNSKTQYNSNLKSLEIIDEALSKINGSDPRYIKLSTEARAVQKTNITLSRQIAELIEFMGSEQALNGKGVNDDFDLS